MKLKTIMDILGETLMKYVEHEKARNLLIEVLDEYECAVKILASMKCDDKEELEITLADIKTEIGEVMQEFDSYGTIEV